ncbi:hypothetical protein KY289_020405 [Solanum tuberosum]|nr:hypothetical protein KY289_020405 [Solanum tuberosum]
MLELISLRGTKLNTPEAIKEEVVHFYKALMGSSTTSLSAVDRNTMKKGPTITYEQGIDLCRDVMDEEIWNALTSIGDDKAPGVYGYNAYFYKKAWNIIKDDMMLAIKEFFQSGKFYRPVNCTVITLVPKNSSPVNIKEYRPIACCTIIYKIIAKVLASRMQKVMAHIISEAQSGFILGRKIADNIILATELVKLNILQQSGFGCGEFPFKYLGVPLSTKKLTIMQWSPLVNKIIARISSWTAKKLSYAGRMQLVQSKFHLVRI